MLYLPTFKVQSPSPFQTHNSMLLFVSTFNAQILLQNAKDTLFKLWKINARLFYVLFLVWMVGINPYSNFYSKILGYLRLLEVEERGEIY